VTLSASIWNRFRHALLEPHYPLVGIEFNSDAIRLAAISVDKGSVQLKHVDAEPLAAGTLDINPLKPNIQTIDRIAEPLRAIWARNRYRSAKVCLLLQDRAALVFTVPLEQMPGNRDECLDLIRFKLRKSVPFRIEESRISFFDAAGNADHPAHTVWAVVINQQVLQQYEQLVESSIGADCGLVDLCTFNLMNLAHSEVKKDGRSESDLLYVNLNRDYISIAITQSGKLMFFRCRPLDRQHELIDEALAEIHPTTMFYVDKLEGKGLNKVFVYSVEDADEFSSRLQTTLGLQTEVLSPQKTPSNVNTAGRLRQFAPLAGLLASRQLEFS